MMINGREAEKLRGNKVTGKKKKGTTRGSILEKRKKNCRGMEGKQRRFILTEEKITT